MNPYTRSTYELRRNVTIRKSDGRVTTQLVTVENGGRFLSDIISSSSANHVLPKAHQYSKVETSNVIGSRAGEDAVDRFFTTGDLGIAVQYYTIGYVSGNSVAFYDATNRLLDKLRSSDLNLLVSAAEAKQSASMILKAARSFGNAKKSILKAISDLGKPISRGSKRAADTWVEYCYGWTPLLNDIYNMTEFHRTLLPVLKVEGKGYKRQEESSSIVSSGSHRQVAKTLIVEKVLRSRTVTIKSPQAFDATRLTSLNPLLLAWEILPYSFVVDWFFDIGGYLQNMEIACLAGYLPTVGFDSALANATTTSSVFRIPTSTFTSISGSGWAKQSKFRRTVANSVPYPIFPSVSIDLNADQILNGAALIRQRIRF